MANLVSGQSLESLRSVFDCPFTLIDVGAAGGVNRRYWKNFRNLTVVGFEPDEREFSKLQESEGQRWYQVALNSSAGVLISMLLDIKRIRPFLSLISSWSSS